MRKKNTSKCEYVAGDLLLNATTHEDVTKNTTKTREEKTEYSLPEQTAISKMHKS